MFWRIPNLFVSRRKHGLCFVSCQLLLVCSDLSVISCLRDHPVFLLRTSLPATEGLPQVSRSLAWGATCTDVTLGWWLLSTVLLGIYLLSVSWAFPEGAEIKGVHGDLWWSATVRPQRSSRDLLKAGWVPWPGCTRAGSRSRPGLASERFWTKLSTVYEPRTF